MLPKLLLFFVGSSVTLVESSKPEPKIIGGDKVENRSDFAFQALLLYKDAPYCGGSIIDERHVLTAAHCCKLDGNLVKPSEVKVVVGNLGLYDRTYTKEVETVIVHKDFDRSTMNNDIALLRISGTFENNTIDIKPINLTSECVTDGYCNVSGWGTTNIFLAQMSESLMFVEVPIINWTKCYETYNDLTKEQICAGSFQKDSCQGDSGGPLVCSGNLTGIVSYGNFCGVSGGVYTEVAKYLGWIEQAKLSSSGNQNDINFISFYIVIFIFTFLFEY